MDVATLNSILALGTIGMQIGALVLLALFFMRREPGFASQITLIQRIAFPLSFILTFFAALSALVHEQVYGLEPCYWCWWQRIVIFPQIALFSMAVWKEKYQNTVVDASLLLSVVGAGIATYHHVLQMFPGSGLPCPATGQSCAEITFLEFGYITYPMMALSLFVFLIVTMLFVRNAR
jgi:disulfide bond formation protein DsbB